VEDVEGAGVFRQEELRSLMKSQEVSREEFWRLSFVTWVLIRHG
jgi:hypothetical protein